MSKNEVKNLTKIHDGKYIKTFLATYQTPKGEKKYEIASRKDMPDIACTEQRPDAVRVLPYFVDESGKTFVVLIKEFRFAIGKYVYGTPAGLIDQGEAPVESAKRELLEEIGAETLTIFQTEPMSYTSVGLCDESVICFEAEVKLSGQQKLDAFEDISVLTISLDKLEDMLQHEDFCFQSRMQLKTFLLKKHLQATTQQ